MSRIELLDVVFFGVGVALQICYLISYLRRPERSFRSNPALSESFLRIPDLSDDLRICEVLTRSIREVCAVDYGNDPNILNSWCSNKTPENIRSWIVDPNNYFVVAELAPHGIVGVGMYKRDISSIELFYLIPEALHRGIGAKLLDDMENEARKLGNRELRLNSSIAAHYFYTLHGYVSDGEAQELWGKLLAFPMKKALD